MKFLTTKNIWAPWAEMDRLINERAALASGTAKEIQFSPACDVEETDGAYLFSFDVPGMDKKDIKIEVRDSHLTVTGERKIERTEDKKSSHLTERYYGSFERNFTLPTAVNAEKVEASYDAGVLRIAVPKEETNRSREVKISDGKPGIFTKMSA